MFLFLKLYLAHLIGDFILQFEELYRLKVRSWTGHVLHVLIHAAVSALFVIPLWGHPGVWLFIAGVTLIHLAEDLLKYALQQKHPHWRFVLFTGDQLVHAGVIAAVFLFPIHLLKAGFPSHPGLDFYYSQDVWTLLAILFVFITFGAAYFLHAFRLNYLKDSRQDHFITRFEMIHGFIERSLVAGFFLFFHPGIALAVSFAAGLPRFFFSKLRSKTDFALSAGFAAALGLLFKNWIHF